MESSVITQQNIPLGSYHILITFEQTGSDLLQLIRFENYPTQIDQLYRLVHITHTPKTEKVQEIV